MKIILSRKGFDQGSGGAPSPILPDGRILSVPIPDKGAKASYGDLRVAGLDVARLVSDLARGRLGAASRMHMDPDLARDHVARLPGWLPAFGQTGVAQSHLSNQGVGVGDLFLFFGWFREVTESDGAWRVKPGGRDVHMLFGWLQVGEIVKPSLDGDAAIASRPWLAAHPHARRGYDPGNTIYVARRELSFPGCDGLPGGGVFPRFDESLVLTADGQGRKSIWRLPRGIKEAGLSYHASPVRWSGGRDGEALLRSAARGQEFVHELESGDVEAWIAARLRLASATRSPISLARAASSSLTDPDGLPSSPMRPTPGSEQAFR